MLVKEPRLHRVYKHEVEGVQESAARGNFQDQMLSTNLKTKPAKSPVEWKGGTENIRTQVEEVEESPLVKW